MRGKKRLWAAITLTLLLLTGCRAGQPASPAPPAGTEAAAPEATPVPAETIAPSEEIPDREEPIDMKLQIGDTPVAVQWEDNEAAAALRKLVEKEALAIKMSMYGGFEQVGSLGQRLPQSDVRMTTDAGDIVLYGGDQIVVFYGSNSWAYTRLGHITDKTQPELAELLGNGDVTLTISLG